ncbi:MAG: 2Fe-2S iron-sulfur cluster-binding protein, partial [Rhodospirillaceae bacterium]
MPEDIKLRAKIRRYDPAVDEQPRYETYEVEGKDNWRVLDVIRSIYEHQAGDLAYQFACRAGRCGTCAVKVNGVPVLACQERCKPEMRIEPLTPFPVLRDLVVDRTEVETRFEQLELAPKRATEYAGGPEPIEPELAETLC